MLVFNPPYRPGGYPPSNSFPAFYKDRKVNAPGSIGQDGRQAMMDRKTGSTQLLAARAGDSMQAALRGESTRPEVAAEPLALNQSLTHQPAPQPLPNRAQHYRLDAGDEEQLVPYHGGGGQPPPDAGAAADRFSVVAPVRDFVSRQYNSLMEQFPHRPRNALERRIIASISAPVPHDPEGDAQLAVENGQAALPAGQPAILGQTRTQVLPPPPILHR